MALLPYILDDFLDVPITRRGLFGADPTDFWLTSPASPLLCPRTSAGYLRPWVNTLRDIDPAEKRTHIGKDGFQVCLDVQHFAPNEINVKTVDNTILVEANHEERPDEHGYISRHFKRRYDLPKGFNVKDVVSSISSDGILTIKAPPTAPAIEGNVRHVQIQQTGPAHLSIGNKEQPKNEQDKKKSK